MTAKVTIPNTFATATTAIPLAQLDANFSNVSATLNNALTYSNYAIDTGLADNYAITISDQTTTYVAGIAFQFKAANSNTGAATLNVNGQGTKSIVRTDGTSLAAGDILAGGIVSVMYDGTNFQLMNDAGGKAETFSNVTVTGTATIANGNVANLISSNVAITGGTISNLSSSIAVASGGTGLANLTSGSVLVGNNTSSVTLVAPGTSGNVLTSNGTTWTSSAGVTQTLTISNKTGAYTVVASDLGKIINCTSGTFTVALTAAATLGAGFNCYIWNTGSTNDVITIDPNGSETIDGYTTWILRQSEGLQIVCNGTNWFVGNKRTMTGYAENVSTGFNRPIASGYWSIAVGMGTTASSDNSTAIGMNSASNGAVAVGNGSIALNGSYASGNDSFAAAIGNNTNAYGAKGLNSVAIGKSSLASSTSSIAIGVSATSSGTGSVALGGTVTASGNYSGAFGLESVSSYAGKQSLSSGKQSVAGDSQSGKWVLRRKTTDATPIALTLDNGNAGATNQIILPNDSTFAFSILVVARRTDADNESAGYKFEGVVDRNGTAATTAIVGSVTKTVLAEDTAAWDVNVTADTTNGGLSITATGEVGKTIYWVATAWTSEVTG